MFAKTTWTWLPLWDSLKLTLQLTPWNVSLYTQFLPLSFSFTLSFSISDRDCFALIWRLGQGLAAGEWSPLTCVNGVSSIPQGIPRLSSILFSVKRYLYVCVCVCVFFFSLKLFWVFLWFLCFVLEWNTLGSLTLLHASVTLFVSLIFSSKKKKKKKKKKKTIVALSLWNNWFYSLSWYQSVGSYLLRKSLSLHMAKSLGIIFKWLKSFFS